MLVIPLAKRIDWRNPPAVTMGIIAVNCFVFLGLPNYPGVVEMYAFRTNAPGVDTAFASMFLHGGLMHLVGNMVFLWLVGCVLEVGCGRAFYAFTYLISGLAATYAFALFHWGEPGSLVGASGAISGLMGAYTVMYGFRKIRVFFSLGFYFATVRIPAIVLLPFWIGNEIFQLVFSQYSRIAYEAHLGGLVSGSLLAFCYLGFAKAPDESVLEDDEAVDPGAVLMEKGLERLSELDLAGARRYMEQALELDPRNRDALRHLFNIDKLRPQERAFHETAERFMTSLTQDPRDYDVLKGTWREYFKLSRGRLKLSGQLYSKLGIAFAEHGDVEEAGGIVAMLLRRQPALPSLPAALMKLSRAYGNKGWQEKGRKCLELICRKYPDSVESRMARKQLGR